MPRSATSTVTVRSIPAAAKALSITVLVPYPNGLSTNDISSLEGKGFDVERFPAFFKAWIMVNENKGIFKDQSLRLALAQAVDKKTLTEQVFGDNATPSTQFYPSEIQHVGGATLSVTSTAFLELQKWMANGAAEDGSVVVKAQQTGTGPCNPDFMTVRPDVAAQLTTVDAAVQRGLAPGADRHVAKPRQLGLGQLEAVALVVAPAAQVHRLTLSLLDLHPEQVDEEPQALLGKWGQQLGVADVRKVVDLLTHRPASTRSRRPSSS